MFPRRIVAAAPWILLVLPLLGGCIHLGSVREFAGMSQPLVQTAEVARHEAGEPRRAIAELGPDPAEAARVAAARQRQQHLSRQLPALLALQRTALAYMSTLGALAGERALSTGPAIADLANGLVAAPDLGLDASQLKAQAQLAAALADWWARGLQGRRVQTLMRDHGDNFDHVLQALERAAGAMRRNAEDERARSLALLESRMAPWQDPRTGSLSPEHRSLVLQLARQARQTREVEGAQAVARARTAETGLGRLREVHRHLQAHVDRLDDAALQALVAQAARDLRLLTRVLDLEP